MAKKSPAYKEFGQLLECLRVNAGIRHQAEFAALVKATQQTVSRWELGLSRPREKQIPLIAQVLNAPNPSELCVAAGYVGNGIGQKITNVLALDQPFPIDALPPESFERFCHYFLTKHYPTAKVHRAGGPGHRQDGIDIEVTFPDGTRHGFQCKRVGEFGPAKVHTAVAKFKRKANKKFLVLSRVASPQTRDAVRKYHRAWEIWDKEDISVRIRELCKDDQKKLVDIFFPGQRLALLGECESGPWQSPGDFFAPFLSGGGAFRHTWNLIGRDKEAREIVDSLSNDGAKVILLVSPGGGGKTRLLRKAIDTYQAICQGSLIRFLSPTSDVTDKSLDDLGSGRKVLVIDDAHDRIDLPLLFQYAARPDSKTTLLLALRPYGLDYVKAQAGNFSLSGERVIPINLAALTLDETTTLAAEVLTECNGPVDAARKIAQVTRDCPLATVMGAQIVAKDRRHLEFAKNDDSFRSTLFGKFQDVIAGEIGDKGDAVAIQNLLRVLALLQPFHADDSIIAKTVESVEGLNIPYVNRLIRLLSDAGILFKRGGQYRLSPDLLADFIIERACIGTAGQSTGYAEQVFDVAGGAYLDRLLLNLGKIDWRLCNGDPSNSRLMDGLWAKLRLQPELCLKAVTDVAYFQPERALAFADDLMNNGTDTFDLTDLLKYASYSLACTPRACDLLWQLATRTGADHAVKVLADLCAVEPNKPYQYNEMIVDFGLSLLDKEDSWHYKYTPFHFLEGILRTDGDVHESTGRKLSIQRFSVSPKFATPLRQKVVDAAIAFLSHSDIRIAVSAARFLKKALHYPISGAPRTEWTKEFVQTLGKIEKTMKCENLDSLVVIELFRAVAWLAQYANDDASPVAQRILDTMPDSLEFRIALALVDEYGQIFERLRDYEKSERERTERLGSLTNDLIRAFPNPYGLYDFYFHQIKHIRENYGDLKGVPPTLYWRLLDASPELVDVTIEKVFCGAVGEIAGYAGAALALKLRKDHIAGIEIAKRFLASTSNELHTEVSRAYNCIDPGTFTVDDMTMVRKLMTLPDFLGFQNTLSIARRIGAKDHRIAVELLRIIDFGNSADRAESVFALFGQVIPFETLSPQDVEEYFAKLMAIPQLDGYWIDHFLADVSQRYPEQTAEFFMKRVEHSVAQKDWQYRPCNFDAFTQVPLRFREAKEFSEILRRVVNWMTSSDEGDFYFNERAGQLFEAMFGLVDERILQFVADWLDVAKPAEFKSMIAIFDKAPPGFIFNHQALVLRLLEKAAQFGKKVRRDTTSALYCSATQGMRCGVPGEPFQEDIKMREEATKVLKEIPRFSPAYDLYKWVLEHAEREIARCRQEAEMFDD